MRIQGSVVTSGSSTASISIGCGRHLWVVESLRGTNRHHRVETVRCTLCGYRERRVWDDLTAKRPTTTKRLDDAA